MDTDEDGRRVTRRRVLGHAGIGLLAGTGLSGVAAARDRSKRAGRPTIVGSTPTCETLRVDYVRGNPPITVTADGPETRRARLDAENRSVTWTVPSGRYELTAGPGNGRGRGTPAVVVEGSPVEVAGCPTTDPGEVEPTGISVSATCLASSDSVVRYTVSNPMDEDAIVTVGVSSGSVSYEIETTVAAGSSSTVPEDGELTANGEWTHEFAATGVEGASLTVNDEETWSKTPDCS